MNWGVGTRTPGATGSASALLRDETCDVGRLCRRNAEHWRSQWHTATVPPGRAVMGQLAAQYDGGLTFSHQQTLHTPLLGTTDEFGTHSNGGASAGLLYRLVLSCDPVLVVMSRPETNGPNSQDDGGDGEGCHQWATS